MTTASVVLDVTQYVRVNAGYLSMILQAHGDDVRIVLSAAQPTLNNTAFHILGGGDEPLNIGIIDTNVWALATTEKSNLTVTEISQRLATEEFWHEVLAGTVPGHSVVHKFGHASVGTTVVPIATSLTYQTPTTAQNLELVSDNAADAAAGAGAQSVSVIGLDANWQEIEQIVAMNGVTPVAVPLPMVRVYRLTVVDSGSYATQAIPSHVGIITCRSAGGGVVWGQIDNVPIPIGQSEIGTYTVPKGYTAHLMTKSTFVDSTKSSNVFFFQRPNADVVVAPFAAMKLIQREVGLQGGFITSFKTSKGSFVGPCDIGFMGSVANGVADISAEFELLLIQDGY